MTEAQEETLHYEAELKNRINELLQDKRLKTEQIDRLETALDSGFNPNSKGWERVCGISDCEDVIQSVEKYLERKEEEEDE